MVRVGGPRPGSRVRETFRRGPCRGEPGIRARARPVRLPEGRKEEEGLPAVVCRKEYCIGCRLCEVFCATAHAKSRNVLRAWRESPAPRPRLVVEERGPVTAAVPCQHCADAPCLEACISGAMTREKENGAVICREERCVGCWSCVMVCPFGAVLPGGDGYGFALKCDLCAGSEGPWCVANCPNRALVLAGGGEAPGPNP